MAVCLWLSVFTRQDGQGLSASLLSPDITLCLWAIQLDVTVTSLQCLCDVFMTEKELWGLALITCHWILVVPLPVTGHCPDTHDFTGVCPLVKSYSKNCWMISEVSK